MSYRLAVKRKKPPPGWDLVEPKLEEFEERMREAMNEPVEDKMRNEMTWIVHKIHYQKNRFMFSLYHFEHKISKKLYEYLIDMKIADGPLLAKWKRPGYETLCSVAVIAKSNTNFRTTGICRVPLKDRHGQITPNVMTGCVSCASGDGGPIWWNDPVPDIVLKRRREVLVEEEENQLEAKAPRVEEGPGSVSDADPAEALELQEEAQDSTEDLAQPSAEVNDEDADAESSADDSDDDVVGPVPPKPDENGGNENQVAEDANVSQE
eukprot:Plantae.Rhodophyta-Purpureofilum_apyrenoidigerum.ctg5908.p1 GENE.Plantae.Rhodophyta-Purpureofilum_apyrenoidigerum.ctg5908~~Plantae.Rhodophyta-Purpureofilum_apyrenoidigerum.ctg5908.p1  ORF type:complete len:300 (-),score=76.41 Plantae.Rhodophyta-Purpureofilum_apyrenoidigerum.ctg5908:561-1355(-)